MNHEPVPPCITKQLVSIDPEILGGTPAFVGTRVPIAVLFENLADGLTLDDILDSYPIPRALAVKALHTAQLLLEHTARIGTQ